MPNGNAETKGEIALVNWSDEVLGTFEWNEFHVWVKPMETPFVTGFLELDTPDDVFFSDPPPPPSEITVKRARWLQDALKPRWLEFAAQAAKIANLADASLVIARLARLDLLVCDTGWHLNFWLKDADGNPPDYETDIPIEIDGSPTDGEPMGGAELTEWSDETLGTFRWSEAFTTWVMPMTTPLADCMVHLTVPNGEEYSVPRPTPSKAVVARARWLQGELKSRWMEFADEAAQDTDMADGWAVVSRLAFLELNVHEAGWWLSFWLDDEDGNPPDHDTGTPIEVRGSPSGPGLQARDAD